MQKNADSFLKYASVVTLDKITPLTFSKLRQRNKIKVKLINHCVWQLIEERETLTFNEKVNTMKHKKHFNREKEFNFQKILNWKMLN